MVENIKILILKDNQSDADLLLCELKKSGLIYTSEIVQTRKAFESALESFKPDIIVADYSLASFDGLTAFDIKQNTYPEIPFIIVSGSIGEENAVELIKNGVTDYALKDKLFVLIPKIYRALKEAKEKRIADEELASQNEEKEKQAAELSIANKELKKLKETLKDNIKEINNLKHALDELSIAAVTDTNGISTNANDNLCKISGYERGELNEFRSLLLKDLKEMFNAKSQPQKQWLRSSEVTKLLNISLSTLRKFRVDGTLTYTKIGVTMYYAYSDIEKILESPLMETFKTASYSN